VRNVLGLDRCCQLEYFYCGTYNSGRNLADLHLSAELSKLKKLDLFTGKFDDFSEIRCENLEEIDLYRCGQLSSLSGLDKMRKLRVLALNTKVKVEDFSLLGACTSLRRLSICGITRIRSLEFLRGLEGLSTLVIGAKVLSRDLSPILDCKSLKLLYVASGTDFSHSLDELKKEIGL
jgi:internalin A